MGNSVTIPAMAVRYYSIGQQEDFAVRIGRTVKLFGEEIAIFRTSDDKWYALENKNPHRKGGPLSEGIVSGHDLYDPLYDWRISLETGKVYAPDVGQVKTYVVKMVGTTVIIGLPV